MIVKTFKQRSSATAVLKDLGVPVRDYNLFIAPADGGFSCQIELARDHAAKLAVQTATPAKPSRNGVRLANEAKKATKQIKLFSAEQILADTAPLLNAPETTPRPFPRSPLPSVPAETNDANLKAAKAMADVVGQLVSAPKEPMFPRAPKINKKADAPKAKAKATKETKPVTKNAKRTVTSVARELIVAGKTNDEVWAALVKEFKLDDGKKSYPAWYRRDCKKRGLI